MKEPEELTIGEIAKAINWPAKDWAGECYAVVIIENNPDVLALIRPYIKHKKLTIIEGDIFIWTPGKGRKFDVIYFDIWPTIDIGHLSALAESTHKFLLGLCGN